MSGAIHPLSIACAALDRVRPLMDGRVGLPGYRLQFQPFNAPGIVEEAFRQKRLDIAQVSPCHFLRYLDQGGQDYIGLPIPLGRSFRHDAIYVRADDPRQTPRDFSGSVVGCPDLMATTHIWQKGFLQDHYGLDLASLSWRIGKVDADLIHWSAPPKGLAIAGNAEVIDGMETLVEMLETGEIDMLLTHQRPRAFRIGGRGLDGAAEGPLRRLFHDPMREALRLWERDRIWPITQIVVLRRSLAEARPDVPRRLVTAFTAAKNIALEELHESRFAYASLPFLSQYIEQAEALFGDDFWPYGFETSARSMEAFAAYCHEQGLTLRRWSAAEIFPALG